MRTITVKVKGKIAVKPDTVRLILTNTGEYEDYGMAYKKVAEATEELKDLFEKFGFNRKDLKTTYFNIEANYNSYTDKATGKWVNVFEGYEYS